MVMTSTTMVDGDAGLLHLARSVDNVLLVHRSIVCLCASPDAFTDGYFGRFPFFFCRPRCFLIIE